MPGLANCAGLLLLAALAAVVTACPELGSPVCGSDGLTYWNECLAKLQGVQVTKKGYCEGAFLRFAGADRPSNSSRSQLRQQQQHRKVPKELAIAELADEIVRAFNADGFVYLGKTRLSKGPKGPAPSAAAAGLAGSVKSVKGRPLLPASVSAVRYTRDGHIYIMRTPRRVQNEAGSRTSSASSSATMQGPAPVIMPNIPPSVGLRTGPTQTHEEAGSHNGSSLLQPATSRPHGRSLSIIVGTDDRKLCPTNAPYPLSAIGQIDFLERSAPFICTGTLITPSLVLTAAHCVWDVESQTFADMVTFAPGRYRTAGGKVFNPFGSYNWSHATLMKSYLTSGEGLADIALIKLEGAAPAAAGTMGLKTDCTDSSAPEKNLAVTTAGYPSDKPEGQCNMAYCNVNFDCSKESTRHSCDTYMGQSGSAFWDAKYFIRGVHVRGLIDEHVNEFTTIGPKVLGKIREWEALDGKATAAANAAQAAAVANGASAADAKLAAIKAGANVAAPGLNSVQS